MKHPRPLALGSAFIGAATLSLSAILLTACSKGSSSDAASATPTATAPDASGSAPAAAPAAPASTPDASAAPAVKHGPPYSDDELLEQIGWIIARKTQLQEFHFAGPEVDALVAGYRDALNDKEAPFEMQQIQPFLQPFMMKKQEAVVARMKTENSAAATAYFAKLKTDDKAVQWLPDGLAYEIVKAGTGTVPKIGDTVRVNYTGTLLNGTVFDSSDRHGGASEFTLGQVITGWNEGLQKLGAGGKIKLYIPAELAYGDHGTPGIPPNSALIFDVELLSVKAGSGKAAQPIMFHVNPAGTVSPVTTGTVKPLPKP